jgi:hypothetical protein
VVLCVYLSSRLLHKTPVGQIGQNPTIDSGELRFLKEIIRGFHAFLKDGSESCKRGEARNSIVS